MTREELEAIKARAERRSVVGALASADDVPALVAEVERLRKLCVEAGDVLRYVHECHECRPDEAEPMLVLLQEFQDSPSSKKSSGDAPT